LKNDKAGIV